MSDVPNGSDACIFNTNPDISGIGVRVSFYLQTFFLVFIVDRSPADASGALLTSICTSFGLTVAALVQAANSSLSFYQALQVTHLVHLANLSTFLALASYSRKRHADTPIKFSAVLQAYFSMALTLALWALAPHFGDQADCNGLLTIIIFAIVPILRARIAILVILALSLLVYSYITLDEVLQWIRRWKKRKQRKAKAAEKRAAQAAPVVAGSSANSGVPSALEHRTARSPSSTHGSTRANKNRRPTNPKKQSDKRPVFCPCLGSMDPLFVSITVMQVVVLVYFVTATELLIKKNESPDTEIEVWGFGQILAMVVTIPAAASFLQSLQKIKPHRKGKQEPTPAQDHATP